MAHRLSAAFAAKTAQLIAEARNEVSLTADELIDAVPQRFDLSDPEGHGTEVTCRADGVGLADCSEGFHRTRCGHLPNVCYTPTRHCLSLLVAGTPDQ